MGQGAALIFTSTTRSPHPPLLPTTFDSPRVLPRRTSPTGELSRSSGCRLDLGVELLLLNGAHHGQEAKSLACDGLWTERERIKATLLVNRDDWWGKGCDKNLGSHRCC